MRGFLYVSANGLICVVILAVLYEVMGFELAALIGLAMIYGEAACARADTTGPMREMDMTPTRWWKR